MLEYKLKNSSVSHQSPVTSHCSFGSGDCFKYAAIPIMPDITALTPAIASVERNPACRLKCAGSMPTAAKPVITPLAPPAIPAAAIPFNQISQLFIEAPWGKAVTCDWLALSAGEG